MPDTRASAAESLRLAQATGEARTRLQALYLRARLNREAGQADKALADYRAAAAILQELYTHLGVTPRETRQAFLTQFADLYQDYIDLFLERYQQDPRPEYREEAFQRSEEARARVFAEMVNEVRAAQSFAAAAQNPELASLVAKEREARLQLEALRRHQTLPLQSPARQPPPALPADLERQQGRALEGLRRLQEDLRRQFPRYADLKNPQPLTFQEIQSLLDAWRGRGELFRHSQAITFCAILSGDPSQSTESEPIISTSPLLTSRANASGEARRVMPLLST